MKKFLALILICFAFITTQAQINTGSYMNSQSPVDSALVKYLSVTVNGTGLLTLNANFTKVPNSGTAAGYLLPLGSDNDTDYVPVRTIKLVKDSASSYGRNIYQNDTFIVTNTSARQKYSWIVVSGPDCPYHPYRFYKIGQYMTTGTGTVRGNFRFQKLE